ncbi:MAG: T9SS type A sorting domain-containing protein [Ignavibacteriales bacterium]|nr:T9SS type A sorting domain-containing protein [Ignavibacteriales bacterium]
MKKYLSIFFALFSTCLFAQPRINECSTSKIKHFQKLEKAAEINYPGDNNIDVKFYKLNLNISYDDQTIGGIVKIDAASKINNLTTVFFDLQNHFNISSAKLNGNDLSYTFSNNIITITLDKPYNENEIFSIDIAYNGTPGSSGFGSFEFNDHNGDPAIWTLSEPYGASDWWPCKDTPADKADSSEVWVTADEFFVTVSNGNLIAEINNGDGTKTYKWKNSYPIAHYLISLAMTNYTLYEKQFEYEPNKFMPVAHYNYPENLDDQRKLNLDKTTQMLQVFSNLFGPYPFLTEKYGHAEFGWGGGMEHQTISSMGSFGESIVAHELAHQWFGDKITCKDWQNIWLNEGFATYSEALFVEAAYGKVAYHNYIQNEMGSSDKWWTAKGAVGSIYVQNINSIGEIFNGARSYSKGATVLHMLRKVVGDENFFNSLKTYLASPSLAYNVATTEDFKNVCEAVSQMDLDYFFNEWIYGENYPNYSYNWGFKDLGNNQFSIQLNLNQRQNSNPTFFTMPIDIRVNTTLGDTTLPIFNDQQIQNFDFIVLGQPNSLEVDPEIWILRDIENTTTSVNENNLTEQFQLYQNYPNPFNPSTLIKFTIPSSANDKLRTVLLKVYDVLGNEITTLVNEIKSPGNYEVQFDASNFSNGVYYYKLSSGNFVQVKKMMLLK